MRRPTTFEERSRYWRAALAGERPATHEDDPQCGLYKLRMNRGEPFKPLKITVMSRHDPETGELLEDEVLVGFLGEGVRITHFDTLCRLWLGAARNPIDRNEYDALMSAESARHFRGLNLAG